MQNSHNYITANLASTDSGQYCFLWLLQSNSKGSLHVSHTVVFTQSGGEGKQENSNTIAPAWYGGKQIEVERDFCFLSVITAHHKGFVAASMLGIFVHFGHAGQGQLLSFINDLRVNDVVFLGEQSLQLDCTIHPITNLCITASSLEEHIVVFIC